ncbi:MAG: TonB-dependent receptor [Gammaproteobacteria bacterium]|nr:TonB-dependent receptor [Gammaproteobacteria bacterium]
MSLKFAHALLFSAASVPIALADSKTEAENDDKSHIEEVVVTGKTGSIYASTSVHESMRRSETPLTSALALADNVPGVSIHEGDAFGFDDWSTTVSLRGFQINLDDQHIGITVDGIPNGNSNYGGGAKANRYIDILNLSGVSVSQGTADISSRSNEALGGTLDFSTHDPAVERRAKVAFARTEFEGTKHYIRYDTGVLANGVSGWLSASRQRATDWIDHSAENERDHVALKLLASRKNVDFTAYFSWDDTHEDNYQRLYSAADFNGNSEWDRLTAIWTGIPHIDQAHRRVWSTLRENTFAYLKFETTVRDLRLSGNLYGHANSGRGDWAPPYLVDIVEDEGRPESERVGNLVYRGGDILGRIYFVDASGVRLWPTTGCVSSITFPYGGAAAEADPRCYAEDALAVQSYRHTHYAKRRTGGAFDLDWETTWRNGLTNRLRAGVWHEVSRRDEERDWHDIIDTSEGFAYEPMPYWIQYDRSYPSSTSKIYAESVISTQRISSRLGIKWHRGKIKRNDEFGRYSVLSVSSSSPLLLSSGATVQLPLRGLEAYVGLAYNYKALSDLLFERTASMLDQIEPETARSTELGFRYSLGGISIATTWYDSRFSNRIAFVNELVSGLPDFLSGTDGAYINSGGIESSGLEVAGVWQPFEGMSVYVAYTDDASEYLGTSSRDIDASVGVVPGNRVTGMPSEMFVATVEWRRGRVQTGITHKFTGTRFVDLANSWEVASYTNTDVHIGGEWILRGESMSANTRLAINNLFDTDYLAGIAGEGAWIGAPQTVSFLFEIEFK